MEDKLMFSLKPKLTEINEMEWAHPSASSQLFVQVYSPGKLKKQSRRKIGARRKRGSQVLVEWYKTDSL
jgi:hypothetical protein